ncbi:Membrane-fusion protein [Pantoea sp. AS-PWVM4]|uniref:HlyD family secretion protein n=1 Tax=Pantoea sp. AS-PWVM4 TaxID=1332069 RepID=UPI0003AC7A6D|nr:HlyD family secretion protein [Pantoea sp. AS-PWVM4]ERK08683.1 Membrane-fusion protein [Pantoea sp. AS-PWVM4]
MLFRKEVSEHLQSRYAGPILLITGWPVWITLCITLLFLAALLLFLWQGSYTRRANVSGEVITWPHTINLFAPEQGVISRLLVSPGQQVNAGTPLYALDISRVSSSGNLSATTRALLKKQQQQMGEMQHQLEQNRRATLTSIQQQLDQLRSAREKTQQMVDSATEGLNVMRSSMNDYSRFMRKGLITTDQQNNQRYLFYQQLSVWHSLNSQRVQQDMQIAELLSQQVTRAADFDAQQAQYHIRQADIERQLAEADAGSERLISAPSAGRISSLSVTAGEMVSDGDSLAQLVPTGDSTPSLVIWLPNDSVPYVKPGDMINISYAAYPAEKYGQFPGKVLSISSAPVSPRELNNYGSAPRLADGQIAGAWFKANVALNHQGLRWQGKTLPLASGMQLQATVFLEKRPLWQWMLSPYYFLKNSITGPVSDER